MIPEKMEASPAAYVMPRPAGGVRKPSRRSRFSARGTANVRLASGQHILVDFESVLELAAIHHAAAHPLSRDIRSQAFAVTYTDAHGRERRHVVDILVMLSDGRRLAIVVKPAAKAAQPEFRATLAAISAALRPEDADELVLVTDHSFSRTETVNAARYLQFLRTVDAEADAAVRRASIP